MTTDELSPFTSAPATATVGWLRQEPERSDETVRAQLARRTGVTAAQLELDAATAALVDDTPAVADRYDTALQRWLSLGAADLDATTNGDSRTHPHRRADHGAATNVDSSPHRADGHRGTCYPDPNAGVGEPGLLRRSRSSG